MGFFLRVSPKKNLSLGRKRMYGFCRALWQINVVKSHHVSFAHQ